MHVRWCECEECLPGFQAAITAVSTTEPAEVPLWRRRAAEDFESAIEAQRPAREFPDPEARKRFENAQAYQKRKLAHALDV